jgi:hypothetical protein
MAMAEMTASSSDNDSHLPLILTHHTCTITYFGKISWKMKEK